jgi:hypothetical protein
LGSNNYTVIWVLNLNTYKIRTNTYTIRIQYIQNTYNIRHKKYIKHTTYIRKYIQHTNIRTKIHTKINTTYKQNIPNLGSNLGSKYEIHIKYEYINTCINKINIKTYLSWRKKRRIDERFVRKNKNEYYGKAENETGCRLNLRNFFFIEQPFRRFNLRNWLFFHGFNLRNGYFAD